MENQIRVVIVTPDQLDEIFLLNDLSKAFGLQGEIFSVNSRNPTSHALSSCLMERVFDVIIFDVKHPHLETMITEVRAKYPHLIFGCFHHQLSQNENWQKDFSFIYDITRNIRELQTLIIRALYPV